MIELLSFAEMLTRAEKDLTDLTDECHGSCCWGSEACACPCTEEFFPAIERIRKLRREIA